VKTCLFLIAGHLSPGIAGSSLVDYEIARFFLGRNIRLHIVTRLTKSEQIVADDILNYAQNGQAILHTIDEAPVRPVVYSDKAKAAHECMNVPHMHTQALYQLLASIQAKHPEISYLISGPDNHWALIAPLLYGDTHGIAILGDDVSKRLLHSAFVIPTKTKEHADAVLANIHSGQCLNMSPVALGPLYSESCLSLCSFSSTEANSYSVSGLSSCSPVNIVVPPRRVRLSDQVIKAVNSGTTLTAINIIHIGNLITAASSRFISDFAEALTIIRDPNFKIHLHLVGKNDTWMPLSMFEELRSPGFEFTCHGWLSEEDLFELNSSIDVALCYSNYPVGVRTRVVDYLSRGLCTIVHPSASGALSYLEHKKNCIFAWDAYSLAEAMTSIYLEPSLVRKIARNGHEEYWRRHNSDSYLPELCRSFLPGLLE
jgi:glycosyltransferase involved in cell wall biosynthesis